MRTTRLATRVSYSSVLESLRKSGRPFADQAASRASRFLRKNLAECSFGLLLPVPQTEFQIEPSLWQLGPVPGSSPFNHIQSDLLLFECRNASPQIPRKDAQFRGNRSRPAVLCS